jgi:hypothetical protein
MNSDDKKVLIFFGLLICVAGMVVAFALPYQVTSSTQYHNPVMWRWETVTTTVTVYGHPIGFVLDGVGFLMFIGGLLVHPDDA